MKPFVTLMTVAEHASLLSRAAGCLPPDLDAALSEHELPYLLGAVAAVDADMVKSGLTDLKEHWNSDGVYPPRHRQHPGILERDRRLAFCAGGVVQLNAMRLFPDVSDRERRDVEARVLDRLVIGADRSALEDYLSRTGGTDAPIVDVASDYFSALFMRSLAESHTMIPDMVAIQPWLEKTVAGPALLEREINETTRRLFGSSADAVASSPAADFVAPSEPAVRVALELQDGRRVDAATIEETLKTTEAADLYGRALIRCARALDKIGRWWTAPDERTIEIVEED